jgi:hypothetical protein
VASFYTKIVRFRMQKFVKSGLFSALHFLIAFLNSIFVELEMAFEGKPVFVLYDI